MFTSLVPRLSKRGLGMGPQAKILGYSQKWAYETQRRLKTWRHFFSWVVWERQALRNASRERKRTVLYSNVNLGGGWGDGRKGGRAGGRKGGWEGSKHAKTHFQDAEIEHWKWQLHLTSEVSFCRMSDHLWIMCPRLLHTSTLENSFIWVQFLREPCGIWYYRFFLRRNGVKLLRAAG